MRSDITQGQTSDHLGFDLVMNDNLPDLWVLLADRSYDFDKVQKIIEARNLVSAISMRRTRKLRIAVDRNPFLPAPHRRTLL